VRRRVDRWSRNHPNANAVLVVLLAIALAAFALVRLAQVWTGPLSLILFMLGAAVGGVAAWLSYQAAYVQRWDISPQMQTALRTLQGISGLAALAAIRHWGPGWLIATSCGFVFVIGGWLIPGVLLARRLRLEDPAAADELYERSKEAMRG
jgi:small-conductance mechanosensitive channel